MKSIYFGDENFSRDFSRMEEINRMKSLENAKLACVSEMTEYGYGSIWKLFNKEFK